MRRTGMMTENPFKSIEVLRKSMAPELSDLLFDCKTYCGSVRLPTEAAEYAAEAIKEHDELRDVALLTQRALADHEHDPEAFKDQDGVCTLCEVQRELARVLGPSHDIRVNPGGIHVDYALLDKQLKTLGDAITFLNEDASPEGLDRIEGAISVEHLEGLYWMCCVIYEKRPFSEWISTW